MVPGIYRKNHEFKERILEKQSNKDFDIRNSISLTISVKSDEKHGVWHYLVGNVDLNDSLRVKKGESKLV